MNLSIVVVTFNSGDYIGNCLQALGGDLRRQAIVVDNNSTDNTAAIVRTEFPEVHLIELDENVGFGRACNLGAAARAFDYVLFLNPDAEAQPKAIASLCEYAQQNPRVGILAPRLVYEDGETQYSCRTVQTPFLALLRRSPWREHPIFERHMARHFMKQVKFDALILTDWMLGAALLISRTAWDCVQGFDPGFFLYCEDMDLCVRVWRAGYTVACLPTITMVHHYQNTSKTFSLRNRTFWYHVMSGLRFFAKYPVLYMGRTPTYLPSSPRFQEALEQATTPLTPSPRN